MLFGQDCQLWSTCAQGAADCAWQLAAVRFISVRSSDAAGAATLSAALAALAAEVAAYHAARARHIQAAAARRAHTELVASRPVDTRPGRGEGRCDRCPAGWPAGLPQGYRTHWAAPARPPRPGRRHSQAHRCRRRYLARPPTREVPDRTRRTSTHPGVAQRGADAVEPDGAVVGHPTRGRRDQLDRLAWSDAEHAARAHDLTERRQATTEPAVRAMTAEEIAHWPTSGSDDATGTAGPVSAQVAPVNDRWALHATARGADGTVRPVWVSCRDENTARDLATEILARGEPEAVHRLAGHLQLGEQLAAQHTQVQASAPPADRVAMAAHIRGAWPADAAAAALNCRAWPTLAEKLTAAQHDGHDLDRLLGAMDTSRIPTARKPAALASWMLDQATTPGATGGGHVPAPEQTSTAHHPGHDQIVSWADQLDPASMIDRVGALGVLGYCGTGVDTRLLADSRPAQRRRTRRGESGRRRSPGRRARAIRRLAFGHW